MTTSTISVIRAPYDRCGFILGYEFAWKVSFVLAPAGIATLIGAGPVNGLFDAGIADGFITGEEEVDEETRSLTFIVCGAGFALAAPVLLIGVNGFAAGDDAMAAIG